MSQKGQNSKAKCNKYIAPGALGRTRIYGSMSTRASIGLISPTSVADTSIASHILFVHYGEKVSEDTNFDEESNFLDVLAVCKKLCDIYSNSLKIYYGNRKILSDDNSVMQMLTEFQGMRDIHVYMENDENEVPCSFILPNYKEVVPRVTNLKINGDLKEGVKIFLSGSLFYASEQHSKIMWFKTKFATLNLNKLEEITSSNAKELQLPRQVIGCYIVGKYIPINEVNIMGEPMYIISNDVVERTNKTTRGPSRGIGTAKAIQKSETGKLPISIHLSKLAAIGVNAEVFASEIGIITRLNTNFQAKNWKEVDAGTKEKICDFVMDKFDIPDTNLMRDIIKSMANDSYRVCRSRLHNHYKCYKTKEECLENPPKGISLENWKHLINHFNTPEFQATSLRNAENRNKQNIPHTVGRRTFKNVMNDNRHPGELPSPLKMWKLTHTKSKGEWIDDKAKIVDDNVLDLLQQSANGENHISSTADEAFRQVVGEKRYGSYSAQPVKRKMRVQAQLEQANQQRDEVSREVKELEGRLEEQRVQQEKEMARMRVDMEAQQEEEMARMRTIMETQKLEMDAKMQSMLQVFSEISKDKLLTG